jgi:hypothetical protein
MILPEMKPSQGLAGQLRFANNKNPAGQGGMMTIENVQPCPAKA